MQVTFGKSVFNEVLIIKTILASIIIKTNKLEVTKSILKR